MEYEHVADEAVIQLAETFEQPNWQPKGAKLDIHKSIANIGVAMGNVKKSSQGGSQSMTMTLIAS